MSRRSHKRIGLWVLSPFALLLTIAVILLLVVLFFTATKSGTAALINFASRTLPALEIEGANGTLLSELDIERIIWERDGVEITVNDSNLGVSFFPLQINLEKLTAKQIMVTLPTKEKEEKRTPLEISLPDIHLPIDVAVSDVVVDELHIVQGEALVKLRDVRLSTLIKKDKLTLHNLSGDLYDEHGEVIVSAKGDMGLSSPHPINLDVAIKANSERLGAGELMLAAHGEVVDYQLTATGDWKYAAYPKYLLELKGAGNLQQLDVESLQLTGDAGDTGVAKLNGRLTWSPELNWELELSGDKLNPGSLFEQYPGQLDMLWVTTGTLADKVTVNLELKKLTGQLQDYEIDANMQLQLEDNVINLNTLRAQVGDNSFIAEGETDYADKQLNVKWELDAPDLSQLHKSITGLVKGKGNLSGQTDGSELLFQIDELEGKVLDYPVTAKGGVQLNDQLIEAQDLQLNVGSNQLLLNGSADENQGINWQLNAKKLVELYPELKGSLKGNGNIKGLTDGSRAALQIDQLEGKIQSYPVKASGLVNWQDQALSLKQVMLAVGKNKLLLDGAANEDLGVKWDINAQNLAQLYPGMQGQLKGNGQLSGELDGSAYKLRIAELNGKLAGRALTAKGDVVSEGGKLSIDQLDVHAGNNHLKVNGQANEPFDLSWDIDASNLSQVLPDLGGQLKGKGALKGSLDQPQVKADLSGKRLHYQDLSIAALDVKADQQGSVYTLDAKLKNLKQGDQQINSASIDGKGEIENHSLNLVLQHKDGKVDLKAQGGLTGLENDTKNPQWQGRLTNLSLRDTPAGNWRLNKPVAIKLSKEEFEASSFCLSNNQRASLCAESQWSVQQGVVAKGKLQKIPLAMAKPWIPETITLPGLLNADFDIAQKNGKPVGKVDVRLPDSSFTLHPGKSKGGKLGKPETVYYTNASANLALETQQVKLKAGIDLKNRGQLRTKGRVDLAKNMQQSKLDINTNINIPDIHWLQQFSNNLDQLKGKMDADINIKGTLDKPRVTGAAHVKNASLYLPETGANLHSINLTAQANRADQMAITGSLKAGQGTLNAKGQLYLSDLPRWKADLNLQGERLLLMNTHEVQAQVSPNLTIKASPKAVDINGTVKIPETTISLRELPTSAKKRSDDIVIIGRDTGSGSKKKTSTVVIKKQGKELPIAINPNVVVELGDKVSFSGLGFKSKFTGRLRVLKTRQDIVAQGVLNVVDGVYQAYGQELEIEKGRLLFDGPIDNPGLDIRAIRRIPGDILVGIALRGDAQQPESELFSDPLQTETDTLSYLLTGRSVASASAGDSALLTSAVAGLGIRGGESLAQKLGGQLGLDDVGISSSTGNYRDSELSLGKQIGTRLYVKYIVGLFDSLQKIAVTYQINERIEAEVLTGEQQEIDLNYKFDTDKGFLGR